MLLLTWSKPDGGRVGSVSAATEHTGLARSTARSTANTENVRLNFLLISFIKIFDSIFIFPFFFGYLTKTHL
jgi:hypothetical protein